MLFLSFFSCMCVHMHVYISYVVCVTVTVGFHIQVANYHQKSIYVPIQTKYMCFVSYMLARTCSVSKYILSFASLALYKI